MDEDLGLNYHIGVPGESICGAPSERSKVYGPNILKLADWLLTMPCNRCADCRALQLAHHAKRIAELEAMLAA